MACYYVVRAGTNSCVGIYAENKFIAYKRFLQAFDERGKVYTEAQLNELNCDCIGYLGNDGDLYPF